MRKPVPADDPAVTDSVLTESYKVRLMVLPVRVCGDVTNFVDTYAFLDAGSEMSFCTIFYLQANILVGKVVGALQVLWVVSTITWLV